jgi:hypothetical protein
LTGISNEKLFWLTVGLLRYPRVLNQAIGKVSYDLLLPSENHIKIILLISTQWYEQNRTTIKQPFFETQLLELKNEGYVTPAEFETIQHVAKFGYSDNVNPDSEDETHSILKILEEFLYERRIRPAIQNLSVASDLSVGLADIKTAYKGASVSKVKIYDPFETEDPLVGGPKRQAWGVDFVDRITQGGSIPGETTLVLAPSGGGKTLLNVQMAASAALNGEDAIMLSYEQNVFPAVYNRIYAFATGLPISTFMGKNLDELGSSTVQRYRQAREKLQGKLHVIDMLDYAEQHGGIGGPGDIASIVEDVRREGKNPRYVGVDWFGPMVNNYMSSSGSKDNNKSQVMIKLSDDLRKVGGELGVNIWLYHQLGTQAVTSRSLKVPEPTDAFECRSLHHYMDTVITVSNREKEHNVAICGVPKLRNGDPTGKHLIKMEGPKSRFVMADGFALTHDCSGVMPCDGVTGLGNDLDTSQFSDMFARLNMD